MWNMLMKKHYLQSSLAITKRCFCCIKLWKICMQSYACEVLRLSTRQLSRRVASWEADSMKAVCFVSSYLSLLLLLISSCFWGQWGLMCQASLQCQHITDLVPGPFPKFLPFPFFVKVFNNLRLLSKIIQMPSTKVLGNPTSTRL